MEAFFPRSGFGQGAPKAPAKRRRVPPEAGNVKMRAVLDEIRSLGTTLRHTIDGEGSAGGCVEKSADDLSLKTKGSAFRMACGGLSFRR